MRLVPPIAGSLKARVFNAGSWVLIGYFAAQFLRLAGSLLMTRLLAPDVFGIMAIATTVHVVISLLADIGLRQAVIQSPKGDDRSFLDTAWTVQILRGCLIWTVCVVVAVGLHAAGRWNWLPPGSVYATSDLPAVVASVAFSAVILGFQSMKAVSMNRHLDLKRVTMIELSAQMSGLAVAGMIAWITHTIWSFVAAGLVSSMVTTLLSHVWLPGPIDRFEWDRPALQELVRFGKWVFLSSALGVLAMNGDRLLLGVWVDPTVLGYYSIAFSLATAFEGVASRLFSTVSLAALSETARRNPSRFAAIYFRMRWPADAAFVGTAGFLFAAGEWIIGLLYDPRYAPAGAMLQWLSFGLVFARYGLAQNAYLALGHPNYLTTVNVVRLVSLFTLVPGLFYLFGLRGAIWGIAFHLAPIVPWVLWFNRRHGLNDMAMELAILGVWPIAWLAGSVLVALVHT